MTEEEHRKALFDYIVMKTKKVAIGPLEYCGNGTVIQAPSGKERCDLCFFLLAYSFLIDFSTPV